MGSCVKGTEVNDTQQIRVRDTRKPGHCWQDNELYDVFQPIIGPMAMLVYLQMTRECYGHTVEFSLRELGAASGVSKDTTQRALGVMEMIGMVRRMRAGSVHVPAQYELADLKELCRHYGGVMHRARASYVLPPPEAGALRERVKEFLLRGREPKRSESTVSVGDSNEERNKTAHISARKDSIGEPPVVPTVSVGDSNPDAPGDGTVSQNGVYCLPGETPLYNKTQNSKTNPSSLPPSGTEGGVAAPLPIVRNLLNGLCAMRARTGDAKDLHDQAEDFFVKAGFLCTREFPVPDRGDGRTGRLDLVVERGGLRIALELDRVSWRDNSLAKLRQIEATRVVVLRESGGAIPCPPGVDFVVAMGWAGGSGAVQQADDSQVSAVDRVMRECGFSDARLASVIRLALSCELVREPGTADEVASLMIRRWREYCQLGEYLRFTWSPKKFFAQGHWLNSEGWPLDQERIDRARGAAVGSYR